MGFYTLKLHRKFWYQEIFFARVYAERFSQGKLPPARFSIGNGKFFFGNLCPVLFAFFSSEPAHSESCLEGNCSGTWLLNIILSPLCVPYGFCDWVIWFCYCWLINNFHITPYQSLNFCEEKRYMGIHYLGSVRFPKEYSKQFLQIGIDILPAAITSKKTPKTKTTPKPLNHTLCFLSNLFFSNHRSEITWQIVMYKTKYMDR